MLGAIVDEVAFVDEEVDAADLFDVRSAHVGGGVGDVGERAVGPVDAEADGAAGVAQGEVGEEPAVFQLKLRREHLQFQRRHHRKKQVGDEMPFDRGELVEFEMCGHAAELRSLGADVEHESEAEAVVEVDMREKDVELVGLEILAHPIEAGAGVEDDSDLGKHQARRLATVVGVVAGGAEEDESHAGVAVGSGSNADIVGAGEGIHHWG